jgi:hypothetical protein
MASKRREPPAEAAMPRRLARYSESEWLPLPFDSTPAMVPVFARREWRRARYRWHQDRGDDRALIAEMVEMFREFRAGMDAAGGDL